MITKKRIQKELQKMPEKFSLDEWIERLRLIQKIEKGENQSQKGEVVAEEELLNEIDKWFK